MIYYGRLSNWSQKCAPQIRISYFVREDKIDGFRSLSNNIDYQYNNEEVWQNNIKEDQRFQKEKTGLNLNAEQTNKLISIYNKYKHVFSDMPGKVINIVE